MIKAIIFDFFGVICSDEYWEFVEHDKQANSVFAEFTNEVNLGRVHWEDFVLKIAIATNKSVDHVNDMYKTEKVNPEFVGYISHLRNSYKTALISNAHHEFIEPLFKQTGIENIFDVMAISSKLGLIKPDPRIFQYTLNNLEVEPNEAIYIDDLERNVEAAKKLGINAFLYQNFIQMSDQIEHLLSNSNN